MQEAIKMFFGGIKTVIGTQIAEGFSQGLCLSLFSQKHLQLIFLRANGFSH